MIFPTPRMALLAGAAVPASGVLWALSPESVAWAFVFPGAAILLFLCDWTLAPSAGELSASLAPPASITCGIKEPFPVALSVGGLKRPLSLLVFLSAKGAVRVAGPQASGKAGKSAGMPFSGACRVELTGGRGLAEFWLHPKRRGWAYLDTLWAAWRGPLGFSELRRKIWIGHNFSVIQDIKRVVKDSLTFLSEDRASGQKSQPFLGEGSEYENLTDFASGMDNRYIDWKRSAAHRRLLAKEFRQERNQHVVLGFDTGRLMLAPSDDGTRLDSFIRAGLSLGWMSLRAGDFVGSCAFDLTFKGWLPPGRTPSFFLKLQKFTAGLGYSALETNFTLSLTALASRLRQRSLLVLFTEFSDSAAATLLLECLELLVRRHTVIFVTSPDQESRRLPDRQPDSFPAMAEALIADMMNRERAVVLERMARLGVHTLDVAESALAPALIKRFLTIKRRGSQ